MTAAGRSVQTLVCHLLVFAQGLVLTPLVVKSAGAQAYGAYVLLMPALAVLSALSPLGVGLLARRELPSASDAEHRARLFYTRFWFQLVSAAMLGALAAAALGTAHGLRNGVPDGIPRWLPAAYLLANAVFTQATDYFRYTHRIGVFNLSIVAQPWLFVLLALAGHRATGRLDPSLLVGAMASSCLLVGLAQMAGVVRELGLRVAWPGRATLGRELRFGLPMILAYLVETVSSSGDRYLLAAFLSVRDVGAYAPACALGALALVVPRVFGVVLPPSLALQIDRGNEELAQRLAQSAARCFVVAGVPLLAMAAVLGRPLLGAYTTPAIAAAAWPVVPVVALGTLFSGLATIQGLVLVARLRTPAMLRTTVAATAAGLLLDVLLLATFRSVLA
ncbi:MAG TPA: lipopolysaccharide biosynthesis protein, partial [Burkholderiaceae bacterium]